MAKISTDNTQNYGVTDAQRDDMLAELYDGMKKMANPTLSGTEAELTGLEIDGTKYGINIHLPIIEELGGETVWALWNPAISSYEATDYPARGPEGPVGEQGPVGPSGADGTQVIANDGDPTATLNTINIDGIVYSIPSGGGSGSVFVEYSGSKTYLDVIAAFLNHKIPVLYDTTFGFLISNVDLSQNGVEWFAMNYDGTNTVAGHYKLSNTNQWTRELYIVTGLTFTPYTP